MSRKLVEKQFISDWLTDQVCCQEDCEGTIVKVQYELAEPDVSGCNWSDSLVINVGPSATADLVWQILRTGLMAEARAMFNIK